MNDRVRRADEFVRKVAYVAIVLLVERELRCRLEAREAMGEISSVVADEVRCRETSAKMRDRDRSHIAKVAGH
jgi:hypothetical protein